MTATTNRPTTLARPASNPYRIPTLITGWAIPFVFIACLWGAGHHPKDAGVSAFAFVTIVAAWLYNKVRRSVWDRKARRTGAGQ